MKWEKVKLGKYVEILSGFAFKSKDFLNCGVPVIKIKNITQEGVTLEDVSYISKELADKNEKYHLNYNDILIALTGSHINQMSSVVGRIARVKYHEDSLLNQRVGKVFAKDSKLCDIDYVYYFLSQDYIKISLASKAGGAANQANISPNDVKSLTVRWPDIETQHRIANILSAYDDLIENNQKQIKLLEEAAQRLYKEWFVDLRFPGHENTKIVDGVPEGWNECTVESFGTVITGKTPPTSNKEYYTNGKVPFVTIPDMHNVVYPLKTEKKLTIEGAQTQKNKYIPPNSVMISCIGTVGLVSIATEVCQTNQQINSIILNNEDDLYFFYESMLRMKDLLDGLGSNGATMTNVNKSKLEKLIIISPSKDIVKQYNDVCKPLFESALNLSRKNVYLKNMREALLPKLMSGEVEV